MNVGGVERTIRERLLDRRRFFPTLAAAAAVASGGLRSKFMPCAVATTTPSSPSETAVKELWKGLTDAQKSEICFGWDYRDKKRGLLRTFLANHWQITRPCIRSDFYTKKQQFIIHDIFKSLLAPEWYPRFLKQLRDDTFGHEWGTDQSIAIFGNPVEGKFQFVISGRHLTLRTDGGTEGRVAFGGPIFYGHAATGYTEEVHHPGNVFWPQAVKANRVYQMLDVRQRSKALVEKLPVEVAIGFQGPAGAFPGLPVTEMSPDQKKELREVLQTLVAPFRQEDRNAVAECLNQQGGLEKCSLAFYKEDDLGDDGEWDNWRLEGPAFVWYFRGAPHVHVWVNISRDPSVAVNVKQGVFLDRSHDPLGAYPKGSPPPEN